MLMVKKSQIHCPCKQSLYIFYLLEMSRTHSHYTVPVLKIHSTNLYLYYLWGAANMLIFSTVVFFGSVPHRVSHDFAGFTGSAFVEWQPAGVCSPVSVWPAQPHWALPLQVSPSVCSPLTALSHTDCYDYDYSCVLVRLQFSDLCFFIQYLLYQKTYLQIIKLTLFNFKSIPLYWIPSAIFSWSFQLHRFYEDFMNFK